MATQSPEVHGHKWAGPFYHPVPRVGYCDRCRLPEWTGKCDPKCATYPAEKPQEATE